MFEEATVWSNDLFDDGDIVLGGLTRLAAMALSARGPGVDVNAPLFQRSPFLDRDGDVPPFSPIAALALALSNPTSSASSSPF
jgi:hypothetical protein